MRVSAHTSTVTWDAVSIILQYCSICVIWYRIMFYVLLSVKGLNVSTISCFWKIWELLQRTLLESDLVHEQHINYWNTVQFLLELNWLYFFWQTNKICQLLTTIPARENKTVSPVQCMRFWKIKFSVIPQMAGVQSYELILVLHKWISSFLFDMTPFAGQSVYNLIIAWLKRNFE